MCQKRHQTANSQQDVEREHVREIQRLVICHVGEGEEDSGAREVLRDHDAVLGDLPHIVGVKVVIRHQRLEKRSVDVVLVNNSIMLVNDSSMLVNKCSILVNNSPCMLVLPVDVVVVIWLFFPQNSLPRRLQQLRQHRVIAARIARACARGAADGAGAAQRSEFRAVPWTETMLEEHTIAQTRRGTHWLAKVNFPLS
jgi:hypothetical protein